jgi:hypothetical protein
MSDVTPGLAEGRVTAKTIVGVLPQSGFVLISLVEGQKTMFQMRMIRRNIKQE